MPYIVATGTEGVGKSTLMAGLRERFPGSLSFREPGGTPMTKDLRQFLLTNLASITPLEQLMMFTTDRVVLNIAELRRALEAGTLVLSDRSFLDTIVYQCMVMHAADVGWYLDLLHNLHFPFPEVVLDLQLDPAIGCARRRRAGEMNDLDRQPLEFHRKVRAALDQLPSILPHIHFVPINAKQPAEQMLEEAVSAINHHLGR